jgi:hypothetical protein
MPRFVILRHDDSRGVHFDLMLEMGEMLRTWALAESPRPNVEITAEALPDHRLAYLQYEGPISGDRGVVTRCEEGIFTVAEQSDDRWSIDFAGRTLIGRVELRRAGEGVNLWRFVWRMGDENP